VSDSSILPPVASVYFLSTIQWSPGQAY